MKSYRRLKASVLALIFGLLCASQIVLPLFGDPKAYPLGTWRLFAFDPGLQRDFVVQVQSREPAEPPCFDFECKNLSKGEKKRIYWAAQALGRAVREGSPGEVSSRRALLGRQFGIRSFALFLRVCDPISYVRAGRVESMQKVAEFGP